MKKADIAIIGTGPAGVSAAITARQRGKEVLLFGDKELSQKMTKAEKIMNYPGLPAVTGQQLADALKAHLADMQAEITAEKITAVYDMGGKFALQASSGEMYEALAVILACGVFSEHLYPGEKEFLGMGVSYCATCDAPLYKGKVVAVIADEPAAEEEVRYLSEVAEKVLYFPLYATDTETSGNIEVIRKKPSEIRAEGFSSKIVKAEDGEYSVSGVFILRRDIAASQLVAGLKTQDGHVVTDRAMCTDIKGCFACGDITGRPYQYIKAAGEGNVAALSALSYISKLQTK